MSARATNIRQAGPHEITYDPATGLLHTRVRGELSGPDAAALIDFAIERNPLGEPLLVIADFQNATGFTREARRVLGNGRLVSHELYGALVGGSFAFRAILNLVLKALSLATTATFVAASFADEAEARAWLTEQRRGRLARDGST